MTTLENNIKWYQNYISKNNILEPSADTIKEVIEYSHCNKNDNTVEDAYAMVGVLFAHAFAMGYQSATCDNMNKKV